jgi:squalene-hopene/tetraprenyl-beta-curcumene cyclase
MNSMRQLTGVVVFFGILAGAIVLPLYAAEPKPTTGAVAAVPDAQAIQKTRQKGLEFLRNSQADDGSWTTNRTLGISGLAVIAALRNGLNADDPMVAKGLGFLSKNVQKDGGVYAPKSNYQTYETCIAIVAFREANTKGQYDKIIADAAKYLKSEQWNEDRGSKPSDTNYGGLGYGGKSRPDLSNTQFLIEALRAAGTPPNDPSLQKALAFVSRCQNLESQANTTEFAAKAEDGGFYYTPAAGGSSPSGKNAKGGLKSYGTMTYAGLKSMIHCDVKADDPRVKAAVGWIRRHYSVTENPGVGKSGLFYYYQTFAKALQALGEEIVEDQAGVKHEWRKDLAKRLLADQKENGSWVNSDSKWFEGDPNLVTAYALLSLSYCSATEKRAVTP